MQTSRGFCLGRKVVRICKWAFSRAAQKPTTRGYQRLGQTDRVKSKAITRLCNWARRLRRQLCQASCRSTRARPLLGQSELGAKAAAAAIPKGHLAVYVGQKDGCTDARRYLVPVMYFNHPLFGELLREAEEEFGFNQPGGITIPCRATEFERVKTTIAGERSRRLACWHPSA